MRIRIVQDVATVIQATDAISDALVADLRPAIRAAQMADLCNTRSRLVRQLADSLQEGVTLTREQARNLIEALSLAEVSERGKAARWADLADEASK